MHDYGVGLNKRNYPKTSLNVQRQATILQCVNAVKNVPQSIDLLMSSYKLKLQYRKLILGTYGIQQYYMFTSYVKLFFVRFCTFMTDEFYTTANFYIFFIIDVHT